MSSASSPPVRSLTSDIKRFPWGFFFTALSLILAGHIIGTETWNSELVRHWLPFWVRLPVSLLLLLTCSAWLVSNRHVGEHQPWILGWCTVIGMNWLGLGVHELGHHLGWGLLVLAGLLYYFMRPSAHSWIKKQKPAEDRGHHMSQNELAKYPPKLVVLLLSPPSVLQLPDEVPDAGPVTLTLKAQGAHATPEPALTLQRKSLDDDVLILENSKTSLPHFNWQQQMRALRTPEFVNVPEIVLFGSDQAYVDKAVHFFKPYVNNETHLHGLVEAKFSDFDALQKKLLELIESRSVKPHQVVVDITGGYAPSSVAAAVFTVKCRTRIQWVPTGDNPRAVQPGILDIPNRYYDIRELVLPFLSEP